MNMHHEGGFQLASNNSAFLFESIIRYNYCKTVVEIGVAFGTSTDYLCRGAKAVDGHVYGFDIWEQHGVHNQHVQLGSVDSTTEFLKRAGHDNFTLTKINSKSPEFKNKLKELCTSIDFAYIDGCHSYDGVKNDFDCVYPLLSPGGIIALDDTLSIDGTREFALDLRTKYYDGTYDIFTFPWKIHDGVRQGTTLIVKRDMNVLKDQVAGQTCGSPHSPGQIQELEQSWYQSEIDKYGHK